jgi:hypothetical protein
MRRAPSNGSEARLLYRNRIQVVVGGRKEYLLGALKYVRMRSWLSG